MTSIGSQSDLDFRKHLLDVMDAGLEEAEFEDLLYGLGIPGDRFVGNKRTRMRELITHYGRRHNDDLHGLAAEVCSSFPHVKQRLLELGYDAQLAEPDRDHQTPDTRQGTSRNIPDTSEARPNVAAFRELLTEAFGDDDLQALCFDHFREVFDKFGSGMGRAGKIQCLLEYCNQQMLWHVLEEQIKAQRPNRHRQFASQLWLPEN